MADPRDIDAACGDVGRDHDFIFAAFEAFEGLDALGLGAVGVERGDGVVRFLELARNAVGAIFRAGKNENAVVVGPLEEGEEQVELLILCNGIESMADGFRRRAAGADFDALRIFQAPRGEALDFFGHGG